MKVSYEKSKNVQSSAFQKRSIGRYFQFFNHFWKLTQGKGFLTIFFLHISPLLQPIETKTSHLTIFFCGKACCFGKTITYISSKNVINFELWPIQSLFQKKYLFRKISLHKLFQRKLLICTKNQKKWGLVLSEGWRQKISEHPRLTLWPKNLGKKWFCKLRQCSFTAPKKCTFCSTLGHKTLSYHKKMKTLFQMTYTIRMVQPRQFIEPGFGVSTYLDFGARLFSTQWPLYGAHILQGLIYGRQRLSQPMQIVPPILKTWFFWKTENIIETAKTQKV